jgi:hypothetical protein
MGMRCLKKKLRKKHKRWRNERRGKERNSGLRSGKEQERREVFVLVLATA